MKNIYLYGAGTRGKKVSQLFREREIEIKGFIDSKNILNTEYQVFKLEDLCPSEDMVVITVGNHIYREEIEKNVMKWGLKPKR